MKSLSTLDVKNAFLNRHLQEEIYTEQLRGFVGESSRLIYHLVNLYMALSSFLGLGLENSVVMFNNLVLLIVRQII